LILQGKDYLNPGGQIALEIDETEVKILQKFFEANISTPFYFKKDLFGRFRYLFIGNCKVLDSE
jgi:methylase of polypeptide subunit release factors